MIWTVWILSFNILSCTFNQNAWICSYERLDGPNYYSLCGSNLATKTTITLFLLITRIEPQPSKLLVSLWKSELKVAWQLLSNCLMKTFIYFYYKTVCQIKIFTALISYLSLISCCRNNQTFLSNEWAGRS